MSCKALLADQYSETREFRRLDVRCPARIRIAKRQYAGFIDDLSEGGAHILTATPIREHGPVLLQLPDLPPIWAEIRWTNPLNGGVRFHRRLDREVLEGWIRSRSGARANSGLEASTLLAEQPSR